MCLESLLVRSDDFFGVSIEAISPLASLNLSRFWVVKGRTGLMEEGVEGAEKASSRPQAVRWVRSMKVKGEKVIWRCLELAW